MELSFLAACLQSPSMLILTVILCETSDLVTEGRANDACSRKHAMWHPVRHVCSTDAQHRAWKCAPEAVLEALSGRYSHSPSVAPHSVQCRQWSCAASAGPLVGCPELPIVPGSCPAVPEGPGGPAMGQICQPQAASVLARCWKFGVERPVTHSSQAPRTGFTQKMVFW